MKKPTLRKIRPGTIRLRQVGVSKIYIPRQALDKLNLLERQPAERGMINDALHKAERVE